MNNMSLVSYSLAAVLFVILSLLLLTSWRGRLQGALLASATVMTAIWAFVAVFQALGYAASYLFILLVEVLRDGLWFAFLLRLLMTVSGAEKIPARLRAAITGIAVIILLMLLLFVYSLSSPDTFPGFMGVDIRMLGFVMLSLVGLVLVEQLWRNTPLDKRWSIKFLCLGVGGLFAYDFILYSDALLYRHIDTALWNARGIINAMVVPLIAISAARNPHWSLDVFVSRHIVLHTTTLLGAGLYLLVIAAGGYYIRYYGGEWVNVAQVVFYSGAAAILLMLLLSGRLRAHIRVLVNKHFFNYKYDYREEWLKFTQALSDGEPDQRLRGRVISAIADMVDSPGGVLWLQQKNGRYEPAEHLALSELKPESIGTDSPLISFLVEHKWVIDIDEYRQNPEKYQGLELPAWLVDEPSAGFVIPLMQHDRLCGIVLLARPNVARVFNWEDSDLLKTAGRQAASHLILLEATQALVNAQQFEAFNRLSAFVIHDLKNIVSQLSLLVSNAEKHKHKPEFIEDMVATVGNSVDKMNRLLGQLRLGSVNPVSHEVADLGKILDEVVFVKSARQPVPVLERTNGRITVKADKDRLSAVLGHIIQNAQDASRPEGQINIRLHNNATQAIIEVEDAGCGMDDQFIRERLFKPFDTTKGSVGMGIGAYESREFVRELGGDLEVMSQPGRGSLFRFLLPLHSDQGASDSMGVAVIGVDS